MEGPGRQVQALSQSGLTALQTGALRPGLTLLLSAGLLGCQSHPSASQLQAWRQEARDANQQQLARLSAAAQNPQTDTAQWSLTISGQIQRSAPEIINLRELNALAHQGISTWDPNNPIAGNRAQPFEGVLISDLLKRLGASPQADSVTFVSTDAFRSTVPMADIKRHPIILATRLAGKPIERSAGGPIYLVFPYLDSPQLVDRYPDRFWAFYVTHVVVGTEPIALRVGPRRFDARALAALPQISRRWPVGFRGFWPHTPVDLHGVRVRDVLNAAGLRGKTLIVRGKALLHNHAQAPISFPWEDLQRCELMLVTASGADSEPINARLGGPLALAISPQCRYRYSDRSWVTFVSALEVHP